ncbi:hypothetical protein [Novosphingobium sp. Rr 2-17]|uniref:hypothetical protein n=1 Tax=Novosphingobium sp. Rr 2-17 TaxID=555793 RepID=UPI001ED8C0BA|nr:hypothetical protein [Novosphingobium sp. Rr 2-17]
MAFFSFFYSNLARFKKFKGLGFEAELWEDKQKEAADLIARLQKVVSVYTREIVMSSVMRGRWGGDVSWKKRWSLFEELQASHIELGQNIDFSDLKGDVERTFIYDLCWPLASSVRQSIDEAKAEASNAGVARFGSPVVDVEGFGIFQDELRQIVSADDQLYHRAKTENIAQKTLLIARTAETELRTKFSVEVRFKDGILERLEALDRVMDQRPIVVTPELIEWADNPIDQG